MTHARTLTRYACLAGLIAGLLAAVPSLATASPSVELRHVGPAASGHTSSHIQTSVRAAYRFSANDPKFYHRLRLAVSRQTLRTGAMAALGRGVMHPAFAAALVAAGFIVEGLDIFKEDYPQFENDDYGYSNNLVPGGQAFYYNGEYFGSVSAAILDHANRVHPGHIGIIHLSRDSSGNPRYRAKMPSSSSPDGYYIGSTRTVHGSTVPYTGDVLHVEPQRTPATEEEIEQADQYISPALVEQLWQDDPVAIPQAWQNAISILPFVDPAPQGQAAPEVHQAVSRWAENMTAQMQGEPIPHPDVGSEGNSASDEILDQWEGPIPPFPDDPQPEWNVQVIDELPEYETNLSGGQCPSPTVVNVPLMGSVSIVWQPICDFASMISGAVKALGLITGLFIVLGRK